MNLFETTKVAVPIKQAAEHYGLKVNRNGMACCANVKKKVGQCLKKTRPPALEKNQATWP